MNDTKKEKTNSSGMVNTQELPSDTIVKDTPAQTSKPTKLESSFAQKGKVYGKNPFKSLYSYIYKSDTRKSYTLLTLTFGFIAILIFFAILPTIDSIASIVKNIGDYKTIFKSQTSKLDNFYKLNNQSQTTVTNGGLNEPLQFFDQVYFPDNNIDEIVYRDVLNKALSQNLTITNISRQNDDSLPISVVVGGESKAVTAHEVYYSISLETTDLSKLQNFVSSIPASQYLYSVAKVDIIPPVTTPDGKSTSYSANINFIAYSYV